MQPAIFVSHGAPTLPLEPSPAREFLGQLGQELERRRSEELGHSDLFGPAEEQR